MGRDAYGEVSLEEDAALLGVLPHGSELLVQQVLQPLVVVELGLLGTEGRAKVLCIVALIACPSAGWQPWVSVAQEAVVAVGLEPTGAAPSEVLVGGATEVGRGALGEEGMEVALLELQHGGVVQLGEGT